MKHFIDILVVLIISSGISCIMIVKVEVKDAYGNRLLSVIKVYSVGGAAKPRVPATLFKKKFLILH